jgi:hypothetical protein
MTPLAPSKLISWHEIGDGELESIISYNELSKIVEDQHERQLETSNAAWVFQGIKNHQGILSSAHKNYKGLS